MVRCVLESIAHGAARVIEELQSVTREPLGRVVVVGGGARIELFLRLLEQRSGREVVAIDCRELVLGLGTFHCLTQQVPVF